MLIASLDCKNSMIPGTATTES